MDDSKTQTEQSIYQQYLEEEALLKDQYLALGNLGLQIVLSIAKDPSVFYVFCPWGSGDTLTVAAYLYHIKQYWGVNSITLVCKKNQTDVAKMYDSIDNVIAIGSDECDAIIIASCLRLVTYGPNYMVGNLSLVRKYAFSHRLQPYKLLVLQIPENSTPAPVSASFYDPYNEDLAAAWKSRIILAPYAIAFPLLSDSFWEKLVQELMKNDFQVFTNVHGEEQPISGTERLDTSVREAFQLARYCAGVISYRSGFSDILALQPKLRHVVINPDAHTMEFDDCSILGNAKELLNLVYDSSKEEQLIKQIMDYFTGR